LSSLNQKYQIRINKTTNNNNITEKINQVNLEMKNMMNIKQRVQQTNLTPKINKKIKIKQPFTDVQNKCIQKQ